MNLTKNFTLEELLASDTATKRGIANIPTPEHIANLQQLCKNVLQPIRDAFQAPIIVISGFRSLKLNNAVGGVKTSQHLKGEAADIISLDNKKLWDLINEMIREKKIEVGQLIDEKNLRWIHISVPTPKHKNQVFKIN